MVYCLYFSPKAFLQLSHSEIVARDDYQLKFILLGDGRVGKTSLRKKYMGMGFTQEYLKTIGVDMAYLPYQYEEFSSSVVIWDIAGQDEFRFARQLYYGGANAAIFVFDTTSVLDLDKIRWWMDDLLKKITPSELEPFYLAILANKIDLKDEQKVGEQEIKNVKSMFEDEYPLLTTTLYKTSALTGEGVDDAFNWVIENTIEFIQSKE